VFVYKTRVLTRWVLRARHLRQRSVRVRVRVPVRRRFVDSFSYRGFHWSFGRSRQQNAFSHLRRYVDNFSYRSFHCEILVSAPSVYKTHILTTGVSHIVVFTGVSAVFVYNHPSSPHSLLRAPQRVLRQLPLRSPRQVCRHRPWNHPLPALPVLLRGTWRSSQIVFFTGVSAVFVYKTRPDFPERAFSADVVYIPRVFSPEHRSRSFPKLVFHWILGCFRL
jgi:hypothetical protein